MEWPYPRLIQTKWHTFFITEDVNGDGKLLHLRWAKSSYWIKEPLLNLGDLSTISQIEVADFGLFYVVCILNADDTGDMYTFYPDTGWQETTGLCGVGINFNGQFVGGLGREIRYSAIGNFDFRSEADRTAGFRSLFIPPAGGSPKILRLLQLGKVVVAYCNNGRIVLNPSVVGNTFTYGEELSYGLGVKSGNHVSGDHRVHGYIDLAGDFWVQEEGSTVEKRGYREYIKEMNQDKIIVSFLPVDKRFYISDGSVCLVINEFGAHHISIMVSGVAYRWDGAIMASGFEIQDDEARITTEWLDYGSRGLKSVESILVSVGQGGEVFTSVDYRMKHNHPFSTFKWVTGGLTGESGIHVTALDFRLKFRALDYHGIEVDGLLANVKYSDQRFKRGSVPEQREA